MPIPTRYPLAGLICCLTVHVAMAGDEPPAGLASLQVPDGFVVERVAGAPLVKHPMLGAFDDAGRLFVCESAGENLDAEQLLERLPSFIRLLEDTNGDGTFDKSSIFADRLTLPTGALWHDGALYVAAAPSIWRLEDTDGDGVADRRDELVTGFKFRGHAGDIHGPHLGPDGRLYFVDGIMGHEIRDAEGRVLSQGHAARVFSSRLDGSDLETFCGGGMANPVAVTFMEEGEMFAATTFFNYSPRDRVRHDAFLHCVYGGVYPRDVGYLRNEFKLTGSLLPPIERFGMSAPSNLARYRSDTFGEEYRDNIFITHFNTRRVTRSRLQRDGSTFTAETEPFLVSSNPDFHPCAAIEDADGSLLVVDTGGWFKIGCPTSSHVPDVLGAIYRVRGKEAAPIADPRGARLDWDAPSREMAKRLDDDRFAVRERTITTLAKRGKPAVAVLRQAMTDGTPRARRNAIWALTRIGTNDALSAARVALADDDASVRIVAAGCAATHRDAGALQPLLELLCDPAPAVRRKAAAALGRIGDSQAVPGLLHALAEANDRMLEHALVYALIEIDDGVSTAPGLQAESSRVRRGTLVALDQMESGELTRAIVTPLIETDDVDLQEAVVDVVTRHPEWANVVTQTLTRWLLQPDTTKERHDKLRSTVYALRREPACQDLMVDVLTHPNAPRASVLTMLQVMTDSGFAEFPTSWHDSLVATLRSKDVDVARESLVAIGSTTSGQFDDVLRRYASDVTRPVGLRVRSIAILTRDGGALPQPTFELLVQQCGPEATFDARLEAARAIGNSQLTPPQLETALALVGQAGAIELPLLLRPFELGWRDSSDDVGQRLVNVLGGSRSFASLTNEQLTKLFENAPSNVRAAAERLTTQLADEQARSIRTVLKTTFILKGGDATRGKEIFFSKRALCAECHRSDNQKRPDIGPDLRRIGEVRNHRDLLEAILLPSASFARGYEPKSVVTTSGKVYSGVIRAESDEMITLYTSQRQEVRIPRADIAEVSAASVSIMPQGLERQLTSDDLRDLLAYLTQLKGDGP